MRRHSRSSRATPSRLRFCLSSSVWLRRNLTSIPLPPLLLPAPLHSLVAASRQLSRGSFPSWRTVDSIRRPFIPQPEPRSKRHEAEKILEKVGKGESLSG
jgi:hypothetical protein